MNAFGGAPAQADDLAAAGLSRAVDNSREPIGIVLEIAGSGSQIALDLSRLQDCSGDEDPSIALAGQVGSQIKIRVGSGWLLASVRTQRQDSKTPGGILANIDFLGEGDEERLTGRIHGFRRGVTSYPIPGALVYPATSKDLREIYAGEATGPMPQPEVDEVLAILERSGAHAEALAQARRYRDEALSDLEGLPIAPERRAELRFLLESVIAT